MPTPIAVTSPSETVTAFEFPDIQIIDAVSSMPETVSFTVSPTVIVKEPGTIAGGVVVVVDSVVVVVDSVVVETVSVDVVVVSVSEVVAEAVEVAVVSEVVSVVVED